MSEQAIQRGLRLEYITLAYNVVEAIVALVSGAVSGSVALISFGVDSIIEVSSGAVMIWRLGKCADEAERRAQKLIACSFFALGGWVLWKAVAGLWAHEVPRMSWTGIALAALSLLVMPALAKAKREVGLTLNSAAMVADSQQTSLCAYLSAILLAGLLMQAIAGWWWADAVASLAMTPIIFREGLDAWRGKGCGCPH